MNERALLPGIYINDSKTGVSSADNNPCIFLKKDDGECLGMNLVYSGNHRELVEVSPYGKIRVMTGINPATFSWELSPQDRFQSPEAVLTYSHQGMNGASQNFHHFINNHIVRGTWKMRERPVLINNWEATYFNFNEDKLLNLAKESAALGIELFVLDTDVRFRKSDDKLISADWTVNPKKLHSGLQDELEVHRLG